MLKSLCQHSHKIRLPQHGISDPFATIHRQICHFVTQPGFKFRIFYSNYMQSVDCYQKNSEFKQAFGSPYGLTPQITPEVLILYKFGILVSFLAFIFISCTILMY